MANNDSMTFVVNVDFGAPLPPEKLRRFCRVMANALVEIWGVDSAWVRPEDDISSRIGDSAESSCGLWAEHDPDEETLEEFEAARLKLGREFWSWMDEGSL